jgi:hypothetical protein
VLAIAALALPASAAAEQRGSTLAATPTPAYYNDCNYLNSLVGGPLVNPWGATSCTYFQGYVFGNTADTRTGFVPSNGVIDSVTVRSGPNPAPLRFVILRQLTNALNGAVAGEPKCCFFVTESAPVQPAPNSVQTFPVNLPVENNVQPNVITQDILGFSAPVGGTLPLAFLPEFSDLGYAAGVVTASLFHPALSAAQNGVGTGGAFASHHYSGLEVLLSYNFTARNVISPGGRGKPIPTNILSIGGPKVLRPIDGALDVILNCLRTSCDGTLSLLPRAANAAGGSAAASKARALGRRKFSIKQGNRRKVRLKLNSYGRKLARRRSTKVSIVVDMGDTGTSRMNSTLKRPR